MKKTILTAILCISTIYIHGQSSLQWARHFNSSGWQMGCSVAVDAQGNIYNTSDIDSFTDFDPGPGVYKLHNAGLFSAYIMKLDAAGNFKWAKSFGGLKSVAGSAIKIDAGGNILLAGNASGGGKSQIVDFDPDSNATYNLEVGNTSSFILKLDPNGNFLWVRSVDAEMYDMEQDASGNIYLTGGFGGQVDFDPSPSSEYILEGAGSKYPLQLSSDIFIVKLDASGKFIWARKMGGDNDEFARAITVDASGNVFTTGRFRGISDLDPGSGVFNLETTNGSMQIFISKLDANGNFVWAKKLNSDAGGYFASMAADASGNVYLCGDYQGTVDFDPGSGKYEITATGLGAYLLKLDASGNFAWAKVIGAKSGLDNASAHQMTMDANMNIYLAGHFYPSVDFDPDPAKDFYLSSAGGRQGAFIAKFNPQGGFIWAQAMSGSISASAEGIFADNQNQLYVSGIFGGTVDLDPGAGTYNLQAADSNDLYIMKLDRRVLGLNQHEIQGSARVYPNPSPTGLFDIILDDVAEIVVYNALGQAVYKGSGERTYKIDLTGQPKGLYLMQVMQQGIVVTSSIILRE